MTSCVYCSKQNFRVVIKDLKSMYSDGKNYEIKQCTNCGLKFTYPVPNSNDLDTIYRNEYRYDLHRLFSSEKIFRATRLAKLLDLEENSLLKIRALELGAGNGELSNLLSCKYGFDVTAVDRNINSKNFEFRVINSSIENFLIDHSEKYDCILISHTLEHLYDFSSILMQVCKLLFPGGLIVIVVPNAVKRKSYWGYWAIPVHLFHFTENFFKRFAQENNLQVMKIRFKSIDTLGFLAGISSILGLKREFAPNKFSLFLLKIFSLFFRNLYHFGNSDLIVIARKL
jgi:2-polyprenyl-3-methyl-5-hydroxy-6-metoxy-1,4-benzoquinol methylase